MSRASRIAWVLAAGAAVATAVWAGDFWREKPASAWTAEEALELLQDSPWAKEELVLLAQPRSRPTGFSEEEFPENLRRGSRENLSRRQSAIPETPKPPDIVPQSATDGSASARYLLRWETARPVQAAFARLRELDQGASAEFHAPAPRLPEDRYVVTVKMTRPSRQIPDLFARMSRGELRKRARLKTRSGETEAVEVERSGQGAAAAVHFLFPREANGQPLLPAGKEKVEFEFRGRYLDLKTKFEIHPDDIR
jgi:hypothetical protein